ncbi:MAG: hypothetical protein MK135_01515 [Polyangiaceae bacterium]|nr:hypothetical protein [Polyangiaceae bacterium]
MQFLGQHAQGWVEGLLKVKQQILDAAFLCALGLNIYCFWGFSVDDALIIARSASCVLQSGVADFNCSVPATNGVTPLGYDWLLALLGGTFGLTQASELWQLARWMGVIFWFAAISLAWLSGRPVNSKGKIYFLLGLICCPWAGAWASAGLATAFVSLLLIAGDSLPVANSASQRAKAAGAGLVGLGAGLRPELSILGLALLTGRKTNREQPLRLATIYTATVSLFFVVRRIVYGHWLPLAAIAKSPDLDHGLYYISATLIHGGLFYLVVGQKAEQQKGKGANIFLLVGISLLSILFAGGDWMPLFRLFVPVVPLLLCRLKYFQRNNWITKTFVLLGICTTCNLVVHYWGSARAVVRTREEWIEKGAHLLRGSHRIATVDIGWVGAASPAKILDLGGVTNPAVAVLPGGHTSKAVPLAFFETWDADAWVIRLRSQKVQPGSATDSLEAYYAVDRNLLRAGAGEQFELTAVFSIPRTSEQYGILRKKNKLHPSATP